MSKLRTRVQTHQEIATETRIRTAGLSDLEEKVLRMRHGLALAPDAVLEQRQISSHEARDRVAAVEQRAVSMLLNQRELRRKNAIIKQLNDL